MKKVQHKDPFVHQILDEEEQAIGEAFARGDFEESDNVETTKQMLKEADEQYLHLHT